MPAAQAGRNGICGRAASGEGAAQRLQLARQRVDLRQFELAVGAHTGRYAARLLLQRAARRGEGDAHAPLVRAVAGALQPARSFEALEQRGERAGIEEQALADAGDGQIVLLPQHQEHQVLGVGEAQGIQQRLVNLGHGKRRRIQREAELVVEQQFGRAGGRESRWHGEIIVSN